MAQTVPSSAVHVRDHRRSSSTLVYAQLRDAIVRAELAPGRQLSENELASSMGVSRTPVREALVRLRDERLVEIVPQLGTFVTRISDAGIADAQFIRAALECEAVRLAAVRVTAQDVVALEDVLRAQQQAADAADLDAFYRLDDELHRRICDLSGHAVWSITQRAKGHLNRIRRLSMPMPSYAVQMIAEHRAIVERLADHDVAGAESALRHHLQMVLREVPRIRTQHPDFFEEAQ